MNRASIVAEVLQNGFDPGSDIAHARRWVDAAYAWVWNAHNWEFKQVSPITMAVVSGDDTPTVPADYGDSLRIFDSTGNYLEQLDPHVFDMIFVPGQIAVTTSTPIAWKMENRVITLGPVPNASVNFRAAYKRRLAHLLADGTTVTAGPMVLDSSQPLWETSHHMVIVFAATVIGHSVRGGENASLAIEAMKMLRDDALAAMESDLAAQPPRQYGRDNL